MSEISVGDLFVNVENGTVIKVLEMRAGSDRCAVATVTATGQTTNRRNVKVNSLKTRATNHYGADWQSGYVKVSALPEGHQYKPTSKDSLALFSDYGVDPAEMSTGDLAAYVQRKEARKKALEDEVDAAKKELKKRQTREGTFVFGDTAVAARPNLKFDAALAKKNLSGAEYSSICVMKPDPKVARALLGEDSLAYQKTLKDHGWTLTVRRATDDDRMAAVEGPGSDDVTIEDFLGEAI